MKQHQVKREEKESTLFGQVIFRYLPYWPLFLILLLLAGGGAWFYLKYATPLYESTARILIKDEKKGAEENKALDELDVLSSKKIIENEVEVIQSRTLIDEVVRDLGLYAPVYEEGKFRDLSAYVSSPVRIIAKDFDNIPETGKVPFVYDQNKNEVRILNTSFPLNQWVNTRFGTLRFIPNEHNRGSFGGKKFYFYLTDPKNATASVQSRLKVTTSNKLTSIIDLKLRDEVPQKGDDILNDLLSVYNRATVNDKNTLAVNTLSFVEDRLKSVEHDLDSIERKNQQYKANKGAIDIGEQGRLFLQNVSVNDQKLSDINMQLAVLDQVDEFVHSKSNSGGIVPSTLGVADHTLSELVNKLYTSELEYEKLKKTTGENSPMLVSLNDQIEKMKSSVMENIRSQRKSLEASKSNLSSTNSAYSSVLQRLPEKERELIDINRDQIIKNQIYTFLLQKREETALSHASTVSDSRIIDKAQSSFNPVSPKKKVIYLASLLIALLAGIGFVTGRESLSRKVMFRHEIESMTEQPIIGEISSESSRDPIVIGEDKKTFIAEQFRKLRTTLKFIGVNSKKKRIMVTSAISGEGKSFVATNLALSLALTGKKVVLVDCDLNNPSLNNKLKINGEIGVTEYLQRRAEPEDIIRPTDLDENLFLISAGSLPRNPSELIMNGRIEELLNYLDGVFDYIVVDTAPVSPVTDAYIISPFCDATLFVIRHKYTPKIFVERIDEDNKINQLNNMAIVFNGVQSRGFVSKNYGYGYGYGYIYNDKGSKNRVRISNN